MTPDRGAAGHSAANLSVTGHGHGASGKFIEAVDLSLSFGSTPALRGASLGVAKGEIVAVMGPSGSGKSTLLHCLAGILVPSSRGKCISTGCGSTSSATTSAVRAAGPVRVRVPVRAAHARAAAQESVALPLLLSGMRRRKAMAAAHISLPALQLDGLEFRRSGELSGGQAQRVALARGLVAEPEVLFADEPTGALDSMSGELVMNLLVSAVREQGATVVLVTHDARVAAYADRDRGGPARSARSRGRHHERGNRDRAGHTRDQHAYGGETVSGAGKLERDASRSGMNGSGTVGLGLRLAVNGGREAVTRLVILAVAVGLGVGLLLTAVAATNAITSWNSRHAWFWTGTQSAAPGPATGVAPLWWHPASDIYDGQTISRFDVAATGASSPVPPGLSHDPAPGTYYASPALAALLRSVPADQLADRYPGHLAGIIGDAALPSPARSSSSSGAPRRNWRRPWAASR